MRVGILTITSCLTSLMVGFPSAQCSRAWQQLDHKRSLFFVLASSSNITQYRKSPTKICRAVENLLKDENFESSGWEKKLKSKVMVFSKSLKEGKKNTKPGMKMTFAIVY